MKSRDCYLNAGGDIEIMREVERIVAERISELERENATLKDKHGRCCQDNVDLQVKYGQALIQAADCARENAELRKDKARLDWLSDTGLHLENGSPIYRASGKGWTWAYNEGYYIGGGDFFVLRDALDAAMQSAGETKNV